MQMCLDHLRTFDALLSVKQKEANERYRRRWDSVKAISQQYQNADRLCSPTSPADFDLNNIPLACDRIPNPFGR